MVNEERLRHMIKMSDFDTYEEKECRPMIQFARKDYVALQMLKSFIMGTIAFGLVLGLWGLYSMQKLMDEINTMDLHAFFMRLLILYLIFMVCYLSASFALYQMRYTAGRRKVKLYYGNIKKVNRMYEREDRLRGTGNHARG